MNSVTVLPPLRYLYGFNNERLIKVYRRIDRRQKRYNTEESTICRSDLFQVSLVFHLLFHDTFVSRFVKWIQG